MGHKIGVFRTRRYRHIKRMVALALMLLLVLSVVVDFSAEGKVLYSTYTPKSEKSSYFYIDVFCETEISAAAFEMQYDDSMVSYDAAISVDGNVTLRDSAQDGKVRLAYAISEPADGQLCRLSFKALQDGETRFVLHMEQAAGSDKTKLPQMEDDTLVVKFTNGRGASVSGSSSNSGKKSGLQEALGGQGGLFDLRADEDDSLKWMFVGAGIILVIGLLILIGIMLGRRMQKPVAQKENPPSKEETDDEK